MIEYILLSLSLCFNVKIANADERKTPIPNATANLRYTFSNPETSYINSVVCDACKTTPNITIMKENPLDDNSLAENTNLSVFLSRFVKIFDLSIFKKNV